MVLKSRPEADCILRANELCRQPTLYAPRSRGRKVFGDTSKKDMYGRVRLIETDRAVYANGKCLGAPLHTKEAGSSNFAMKALGTQITSLYPKESSAPTRSSLPQPRARSWSTQRHKAIDCFTHHTSRCRFARSACPTSTQRQSKESGSWHASTCAEVPESTVSLGRELASNSRTCCSESTHTSHLPVHGCLVIFHVRGEEGGEGEGRETGTRVPIAHIETRAQSTVVGTEELVCHDNLCLLCFCLDFLCLQCDLDLCLFRSVLHWFSLVSFVCCGMFCFVFRLFLSIWSVCCVVRSCAAQCSCSCVKALHGILTQCDVEKQLGSYGLLPKKINLDTT